MTTSLLSASAHAIVFSFAVLVLCNPSFCLNLSVCQNASCGVFAHISYPFGLTDTGCGHPDFQIVCISDTPHLTINGVNYTILNQSRTKITVVNDGVSSSTDQTCGLPDASVNLSASPFKVTTSYLQNLILLTGCPFIQSSVFSLPCNPSWLYSLGEIPPPLNGLCKSVIQVPIPQIQVDIWPIQWIMIEKLLHQGFEIEWNETDEIFRKCAGCKEKKGICWFDASDQFICHIPQNMNSTTNGSSPDQPENVAAGPISVPPKKLNTPIPAMSGARHIDRPYTGIIIGVCIGFGLLISTASIAAFMCYIKNPSPKQKLEISYNEKSSEVELGAPPIKKGSRLTFSYQELQQATDNFDAKRELGDGGFASVYLGKLWDGRLVAVKKLFHDNCRRVEQFANEVEILSSLNHPNLVLLIGYCQYLSELLLVYEYASNGTLADHLHGETKATKSLVWETRLNIAVETARALAYLHFSIKPPIFHRDVKSSNILLDQNFKAKVADFGLSRLVPLEASHISTGPQGTPGYVDPDYHHCHRLTDKSDVYSFGVVLAELISAKKAVDITRENKDIGLANLFVSKIQCGALKELVDPYLKTDVKPLVSEMVCRVGELAFRCLAAEKDDRPNMVEVTAQLQDIQQFGYGGCTKKELSPYNSFDGVQKTRKWLSHVYTGSPTSVQEKWSTSTTPDSSENGFV